MNTQGYRVFLSHTKKDKDFCDLIDKALAREAVAGFRSEFESIASPPFRKIREAMNESIAFFLIVGRELVDSQAHLPSGWKYTQNWIAYEIGLACAKEIDVWVLCDDGVEINFPVPYYNNYVPFGIRSDVDLKFLRNLLKYYAQGGKVTPLRFPQRAKQCTNPSCLMEFNLHFPLSPGSIIKCPCCLKGMKFPKGFRVK